MDILSRLMSEAVDVNRQLGRLADDYDPATLQDSDVVRVPRQLKLRADSFRRRKAALEDEFNEAIGRANAHDLRSALVEVDSMRSEVRDRRLKTLSGTSPQEIELPLLRRKIEIRSEEILLSSLRSRLDHALSSIKPSTIIPGNNEPLSEVQLNRRPSLSQKEAAAALAYGVRNVRKLLKASKLTPTTTGRITTDEKFKAVYRKRHNPVRG